MGFMGEFSIWSLVANLGSRRHPFGASVSSLLFLNLCRGCHSGESSCVRVYYIGCSALPFNFAQEQNRESRKHEVRELRRHGQSLFTRLGNLIQERQARREASSWPLQGSSVGMLNFCRHRNRGPQSASFQRPADNETRVVVFVGLPDGGVFDFVDRFIKTTQVASS